ncbi:GNAT family N-acetyltransferase [Corynebacterium sp.]|uniref:GNAT family N-acetyltransferase n=1 Tax=Corynebacterium sp. TaxID=1720 RepID=UPI0026DC396D|nr:GNAT family protein [Corynebacterium sp.]MDO5032143.1 GNAT family protein [Corynebacterium sp.]
MNSGYTTPVHLSGDHVTLEPLSLNHADGLAEAVRDGELYSLWYTSIPRPEEMQREIRTRLQKQEDGLIAAYTVLTVSTATPIGMTTFLNPDTANQHIEIGSTWISAAAQGTKVNKEMKFLMLRHAFETLQCERVELRTHHMNRKSRAAIESLGAHLDGILRRHRLLDNGTWRDTCVYSILRHEWPTVKAGLAATLAQ